MRITRHTDYALRLMMHLGLYRNRLVTVGEVADAHGISRHHLMKVAQRLAALGYIEAVPGRGGGLSLACEPEAVNIGRLVREVEPDLCLVECFDPQSNTCPIAGVCRLQGVLGKALAAFLAELDGSTLVDLLRRPGRLRARLEAGTAA